MHKTVRDVGVRLGIFDEPIQVEAFEVGDVRHLTGADAWGIVAALDILICVYHGIQNIIIISAESEKSQILQKITSTTSFQI